MSCAQPNGDKFRCKSKCNYKGRDKVKKPRAGSGARARARDKVKADTKTGTKLLIGPEFDVSDAISFLRPELGWISSLVSIVESYCGPTGCGVLTKDGTIYILDTTKDTWNVFVRSGSLANGRIGSTNNQLWISPRYVNANFSIGIIAGSAGYGELNRTIAFNDVSPCLGHRNHDGHLVSWRNSFYLLSGFPLLGGFCDLGTNGDSGTDNKFASEFTNVRRIKSWETVPRPPHEMWLLAILSTPRGIIMFDNDKICIYYPELKSWQISAQRLPRPMVKPGGCTINLTFSILSVVFVHMRIFVTVGNSWDCPYNRAACWSMPLDVICDVKEKAPGNDGWTRHCNVPGRVSQRGSTVAI